MIEPDELKRLRDADHVATHSINVGRIRERQLSAELAELRKRMRKLSRLRCLLRKGLKAHEHMTQGAK